MSIPQFLGVMLHFNPWIGCTRVSEGCVNCYAERDNKRYNWVNSWGPQGERYKTGPINWSKPIVWNQKARKAGKRTKVFCASLSDVFEARPELVPWRKELWDLIAKTPHLDWLLLTKRPENVMHMVPWQWDAAQSFPDNIWVGTTTENQARFDERMPLLMNIPARIHFVSMEPMLSRINIMNPMIEQLDWVIVGGESGPNARPMDIEWAKDMQLQCKWTQTPFFFKQIGGNKRVDGYWGSNKLDGKVYQEFPDG